MSRKFSLAYLTIPGTNPIDQIKIAAEAGYDFVSLRPIPMHLPNEPLFQFDKDSILFHNIKQALLENNISIMDIELARVREDLDIEEYESAFEAAAELGATDILSSIWTRDKNYAFKKFSKICDMASKYSLKVNLEFVTFSGVRELKDALEILDNVNRPNAYLLIDTLYVYGTGLTAEDLAKIDKNRIGIIHVCDGPEEFASLDDEGMMEVAREKRLYPGDGAIDIKGLLQAMPHIPISIELPNSVEMKRRGAYGHALECLKRTKELIHSQDSEVALSR